MPTVPTYQTQVSPNVAPTVTLQSTAPAAAFGGGIAEAEGKIADDLFKQELVDKAKNDTATVLKATNIANGQLADLASSKLSLKGENAVGATQSFDKDFSEIVKNTMPMLKNDTQRAAFSQHMGPNAFNYKRSIETHERNQKDEMLNNEFKTANAIQANNIIASYNNPELIDGFLKTGNATADARGQVMGLDKDTVNQYKLTTNSKSLVGAIDASLDNDNPDKANQILSMYGGQMTAADKAAATQKVNKVLNKNEVAINVQTVVHQNIRADGTPDVEKIHGVIEQMYGPNKKQQGTNITYSSFKSSLVSQESGGNYNAKGAIQDDGDYAIGKYQIMKSNWSNWAKDAGLSPNAEPTPENQEKIADAKLQPLFNKYGADGAAVAWYSGEQNAARWKNGEKDAIDGNGNHYSWDAPQGNAPSIRGYVESVTGNSEKSGKPFNADMYNSVMSKADALIADITKEKADKEKQYKTGLESAINSSASLSQALDIIQNADLPLPVRNSLTTAANIRFNTLSYGTPYEKRLATYEITGLKNDLTWFEAMKNKDARGVDFTTSEQIAWDQKADRYNEYVSYVHPAGFELMPKFAEMRVDVTASKKAQKENEQMFYTNAEKMAELGYNKAEITQTIMDTAKSQGFDGTWIVNNINWKLLGSKGVE